MINLGKYDIEGAIRSWEIEVEEHEKLLEEYDNSVTKFNKWNIDFRIEEAIKREETYHRILKNMKLLHMGNNPLTDWELYGVSYDLDTSIYKSAPSSLYIVPSKLTDTRVEEGTVLCKLTNTLQINQGRLVSWCRFDHRGYGTGVGGAGGFMFRNTSSVGNPNFDNGYAVVRYVRETTVYIKAYRIENASKHEIKSVSSSLGNTTWYKLRVTWWEDQGILFIRFEKLNGSWAKLLDDITDTENAFSGQSTLRVGFYVRVWWSPTAGSRSYNWFDDTEIWKAS